MRGRTSDSSIQNQLQLSRLNANLVLNYHFGEDRFNLLAYFSIYNIIIPRVQNTHHKFMRASYMKHFAKFLAILHHNASFFNFCFIINFGFIKNLLHILEMLKYYCCLCLRSLCCWLSLLRVVRFSAIFGSTSMQIFCYYNAWLGKCL